MIILVKSKPEIIPSLVNWRIRNTQPHRGFVPNPWGWAPKNNGYWWRKRKTGVVYTLFWNPPHRHRERLEAMGYEVVFGGKR